MVSDAGMSVIFTERHFTPIDSRFNTLPGVKHDGNFQKRNGQPTKFKFLNFVNNYYYLNISIRLGILCYMVVEFNFNLE